MKRALLSVSFGTSVPQAMESITAVERALAAAAPERDFFRAFTSPTIRRILAGRGQNVLSLEEQLERLAAAGYSELFIQPTHLLYGFEYDKIKAASAAFVPRFRRLTLGLPLLSRSDDLLALAHCLNWAYPADGGALVLLGHGTAHFANMVYPALQTALHLAGRRDALVGTVEGWPGFDEVLTQLRAGGYQRATLVPLMLVAGDHACSDMAGGRPDSWRSRLQAAGLSVNCHMWGLGLLPEVQALYIKHLKELL